MHWEVKEQFVVSKTGKEEDCEDAIFLNEHFAAVMDATSETGRSWNGLTGGRMVAQILCAAMNDIPAEANAYEAADMLTSAIWKTYEHYGVLGLVREDPAQRVSASIIIFSAARMELWSIGDCQGILCSPDREDQGRIHTNKEMDLIATRTRSAYIRALLASGLSSIDDLLEHDIARDRITPLLTLQCQFQNSSRPGCEDFSFSVLNGYPVDDFQIHPVYDGSIILATDGYPSVYPTLAESEQYLQTILAEDPLMYERHPATKGLQMGQQSYDNRAFLRLEIVQTEEEKSRTRLAHHTQDIWEISRYSYDGSLRRCPIARRKLRPWIAG